MISIFILYFLYLKHLYMTPSQAKPSLSRGYVLIFVLKFTKKSFKLQQLQIVEPLRVMAQR